MYFIQVLSILYEREVCTRTNQALKSVLLPPISLCPILYTEVAANDRCAVIFIFILSFRLNRVSSTHGSKLNFTLWEIILYLILMFITQHYYTTIINIHGTHYQKCCGDEVSEAVALTTVFCGVRV